MIRFIKVRNVQNGYAKVFYKKRNANVAGHCSAFKIDTVKGCHGAEAENTERVQETCRGR